ncbi:MAG: hypothetical protein NZ455_14530 [Bacteroidia bacterium]|nr:hypothetical protein [Bacteroidia bacterium]MDW8347511.1 hypothetical protein [Bacteroidia bacterium]
MREACEGRASARCVAPKRSAARSTPTRSAAKGHAQNNTNHEGNIPTTLAKLV